MAGSYVNVPLSSVPGWLFTNREAYVGEWGIVRKNGGFGEKLTGLKNAAASMVAQTAQRVDPKSAVALRADAALKFS